MSDIGVALLGWATGSGNCRWAEKTDRGDRSGAGSVRLPTIPA